MNTLLSTQQIKTSRPEDAWIKGQQMAQNQLIIEGQKNTNALNAEKATAYPGQLRLTNELAQQNANTASKKADVGAQKAKLELAKTFQEPTRRILSKYETALETMTPEEAEAEVHKEVVTLRRELQKSGLGDSNGDINKPFDPIEASQYLDVMVKLREMEFNQRGEHQSSVNALNRDEYNLNVKKHELDKKKYEQDGDGTKKDKPTQTDRYLRDRAELWSEESAEDGEEPVEITPMEVYEVDKEAADTRESRNTLKAELIKKKRAKIQGRKQKAEEVNISNAGLGPAATKKPSWAFGASESNGSPAGFRWNGKGLSPIPK